MGYLIFERVGGGGAGRKGFHLRSNLSGAVAVVSQDACKKGGCPVIRPPLKKSLFHVQSPGENICSDWDLFRFFNFFQKKSLQKKTNGK